jgi:hypothetical protein
MIPYPYMKSKKILEKDYNDLQTVHKNNVCKLHNVQKTIERLRKDAARLQIVTDNLLNTNMRNGFKLKLYRKKMDDVNPQDQKASTPRTFRTKVDYAVRCIDWLKNNRPKNSSFSQLPMDNVINTCHIEHHDDLLNGFTFALPTECTSNGCMSWTHGQTHCHCGKTRVCYDKKNINYGYEGDIHIDDTHPLYRVSFYY